jgi:hypothetical protein
MTPNHTANRTKFAREMASKVVISDDTRRTTCDSVSPRS